jgi:hypothetical protein
MNIQKIKYNNILKFFLFGFCIVILFTSITYNFDYTHFNGLHQQDDNTFYHKLFNRFYFSVTTLSSAGYGDITPKTIELRSISMAMQFILIIGIFGGLYSFF